MTSAKPCPSVPAYRVNLVNEYDTWRLLFPLIEQIPHPGSTHANKHLHKV